MMIPLWFLWSTAVVAQCVAPLSDCAAKCDARKDSVAQCSAQLRNGTCTVTTTCQCDGLLRRCAAMCTASGGVKQCSCTMGRDEVVCVDSNLSIGAVAAIAVVCVRLLNRDLRLSDYDYSSTFVDTHFCGVCIVDRVCRSCVAVAAQARPF